MSCLHYSRVRQDGVSSWSSEARGCFLWNPGSQSLWGELCTSNRRKSSGQMAANGAGLGR